MQDASSRMNIQYENYTDRDIDAVKWQIHSASAPICAVAERCVYGFPRIVVLSPLSSKGPADSVNHEALSNLIWLTCPYLNDGIHRFEDRGYVSKISSLIESRQVFKEMMAAAHSHFYYFRKQLYRNYFGGMYPEDLIGLFDTGVGGVRDGSALKCLHMNFAHYRLDESNVAGHITQKLLGDAINCPDRKCGNAFQ